MKKLIPILIILLALSLSLNSISSADLYKKLQGAYKGLSSYQASVSQSNYYPQLKKTITYTGKIYFIPGRMLMHFDKPNLQRLHIEAGKVTLYDALSNTVFTSEIQPQYGRMNPLEILQLYWDRSTVSLGKQKGDLMDVTLKPTKDAMLVSLSATINTKNGQVQKLSYKDAGGNSVSYSFSGIKLNGGIPASVWKFTYPKDAQRIDQ